MCGPNPRSERPGRASRSERPYHVSRVYRFSETRIQSASFTGFGRDPHTPGPECNDSSVGVSISGSGRDPHTPGPECNDSSVGVSISRSGRTPHTPRPECICVAGDGNELIRVSSRSGRDTLCLRCSHPSSKVYIALETGVSRQRRHSAIHTRVDAGREMAGTCSSIPTLTVVPTPLVQSVNPTRQARRGSESTIEDSLSFYTFLTLTDRLILRQVK